MRLLFALTISLSSWTAFAGIHDDIENCQVLSDAACVRSILHSLARGEGGGGSNLMLFPGTYTVRDGSDGTPIGIEDVQYAADGSVVAFGLRWVGTGTGGDFHCTQVTCRMGTFDSPLTILGQERFNYDGHDYIRQ